MATNRSYSPFSKKPKLFYGYWIVVATFFCLFIQSGCAFFAFSLFVKPLQAEFGWGRGGIMLGFTIFILVGGLAAPYIGRLVDRYAARNVIAIGAFIAGLGFALLSRLNSIWYFYLCYAVIGVGMAAVGHISATAVVSNWFKKWRGTAIGIMSGGMGAGGFAIAPLIGGWTIPNLGWKVSYFVLALVTWLVIPLSLLVIKTKPADMGLYPDGRQDSEVEVTASLPTTENISPRMAFTTSSFWLIAFTFLAFGFSRDGILQSQVPYLVDVGFSPAMGATVFGVVGLWSLMGKPCFGWLCDRINAKYACAIGLGFELVGIIILMSVQPASPMSLIWLYTIIMGLGIGCWVPTMSMLISTNFGLTAYGVIFGIISLVQSAGCATGPLMAGYMYDTMSSYRWAFIILLASCVVAIPAILAVHRPKPPGS